MLKYFQSITPYVSFYWFNFDFLFFSFYFLFFFIIFDKSKRDNIFFLSILYLIYLEN